MNFDLGSFIVILCLIAFMFVDCKLYQDCMKRINELEEKFKK